MGLTHWKNKRRALAERSGSVVSESCNEHLAHGGFLGRKLPSIRLSAMKDKVGFDRPVVLNEFSITQFPIQYYAKKKLKRPSFDWLKLKNSRDSPMLSENMN
eukprot:TRINITY_DN22537_c0_g1_i1.p1 TRINITY_DN22537_c0_g1~~TRINITY_DN22537_c0_g1_i1.p1  ORF type:complete len:102 (+),score=6.62 TRINITY_DN22537_c0_g1_i1:40-345(+)